MSAVEDQVQIIRDEVEAAAEAMIAASLRGLRLVSEHKAGDVGALDGMESIFCAILEACAFQDLTGQRLTRLVAGLTGADFQEAEHDPLLNGPADPGAGLDQDLADRLLAAG